jgi:hypothetical protein
VARDRRRKRAVRERPGGRLKSHRDAARESGDRGRSLGASMAGRGRGIARGVPDEHAAAVAS